MLYEPWLWYFGVPRHYFIYCFKAYYKPQGIKKKKLKSNIAHQVKSMVGHSISAKEQMCSLLYTFHVTKEFPQNYFQALNSVIIWQDMRMEPGKLFPSQSIIASFKYHQFLSKQETSNRSF